MLALGTPYVQQHIRWVCLPLKTRHELSSDRRKTGQFLSSSRYTCTKGLYSPNQFAYLADSTYAPPPV